MMPPLRIGYDLSFLAPVLGRRGGDTGVGRVIRQLLAELLLRPDVDIRVVGSFADDWNYMSTSLRVERWAASQAQPPIRSLTAFGSRIGLGRGLSSCLLSLEESAAWTTPRASIAGSTRARPGDLALRVLRKIASLDSRPRLPAGDMDVFHATFMPPPRDSLASSVPRVVTVHDVIPGRFPEECGPHAVGLLSCTIGALHPERDVVVTNSAFTRADFCAFTGFPEHRTVAAPLAVGAQFRPVTDVDALQSMRERLGMGDRPYFLNVANLQPRKNVPLLVRAFYEFLDGSPEWDCVMVLAGSSSSGPDEGALQLAIHSEPRFASRVLRTGVVPEADLPALYSAALALVFPSYYEGFGLPVLEAMACGTPVICSDSTSLPEVAGDAAVLVDARDPAAIAHAMQSLAQQETLRQELRRRGLLQAGRFSWAQTAERVTEAYRLASGTAFPGRNGGVS